VIDLSALKGELAARARALGFAALGVAGISIPEDERHLLRWLDEGFHGEMHYMQRHGVRRSRPQELAPGTVRVVSARLDYWPQDARDAPAVLAQGGLAYVSRYALGRDYHKILRQALHKLALQMQQRIGAFGYRVCVDSAPVLEKAHALDAGLGWIGKHTNLIARISSSARSSPIFPCRLIRPRARTVAPAAPASRPAPPRPSSLPTGWMRGAASRT
jgi:epoxyqueuosine reductase